MSRKIKKKKSVIATKAPAKKQKSKGKSKIIVITVSALIAVSLLIAGVVAIVKSTSSFDYEGANLSNYITLSEQDYNGFEHPAFTESVDTADVDRLINALLCQNKNKTALYDAQNVTSLPITLGDVAKIRYRGYTVDENGNQTDFDANLFSSKAYSLEIGSGSFIEGFEEALLGIVPKDYPQFVDKTSGGKVSSTDVIYLTYKALYPDGKSANVTAERIDLTLENIDKKYGIGFKEYFASGAIDISTKIKDQKIFTMGASGDVIYYDMTVNYVIRKTDAPLTISVRFPETYHAAHLRGVDAKFDVYIEGAIIYDTPEYNEDFIKDTLKLSLDKLSAYQGDTLIEKHRSMLLDIAKKDLETRQNAMLYELLWDYLLAKTTVKKLPEKEVEKYFMSEYDTVYVTYTYYQSVYNTFGDFAKDYYGLSSADAWRDHIYSLAETTVKEKLIIYYIISSEELIPEEKEYKEHYDEILSEYLSPFIEAKKSELEAATTEEEYNAKMEEIKNDAIKQYGDEFFKTSVYYEIVSDWLIENSKK